MRLLFSLVAVSALWGQQRPGQPIEMDDTISVTTRRVVVHTSVTDKSGTPIGNLPQKAFKVFENGQPQEMKEFKREDIPVSLGLVIDDSGSMRDLRANVESAALTLVRSSKRQDEVFVVNYSDVAYLDVELTSDVKKLEEGVQRRDSRGGTAMRDALSMSMDYLNKEAKKAKRVLLVVTDGNDNASSVTLERLVAQAKQSEVLIYAIGLLQAEDRREARRAQRALDELANSTGGLAFYPKSADEVQRIAETVADELRNQYVVVYSPSSEELDGSYRTIKVTVDGARGATVRHRTGYYATPNKAVPVEALAKPEGTN